MSIQLNRGRDSSRRGTILVLTTVMLAMLVGFVAFAIDTGVMCVARAEAQNAADSAALAAAWELLDQDRLKGAPDMTQEISDARAEASIYAGLNAIRYANPLVDLNTGNSPEGDVVVGYLHDPTNQAEAISFDNPSQFNTVRVRIRRNEAMNGPIQLFFAAIFGQDTADVTATGTATFKDGVVGYRVTDKTGNAELLPLALHVDAWTQLLNGTLTIGDSYTVDPETGAVSNGPDGILELNLYPGAGPTQLPPGNFGTVDIGSPNNSTADISRQILEGVNANDLSYFGGQLLVGESGLDINGDTGLSAGIADELAAIEGIPRAIPIFDTVSGPGNNSTFHVVGFAGIRITNVRLTGSMGSKEVVIQPGYVVDDAVITDEGSGPSYFVYKPVQLVR
jgi:Flp pilus assembly protein TadG